MSAADGVSGLEAELESLRTRLREAEETLGAIRSGEVDAVLVDGPDGARVFTLTTAAEPYRQLVERMAQGALTVSPEGLVLFCNDSFARLLGLPRDSLFGRQLEEFLAPGGQGRLARLLAGSGDTGREIAWRTVEGDIVETAVTATTLSVAGEEVRSLIVSDLSQQELRLRYAAVVEASHDQIYTLDDQLVVQTWNRGAAELTGLSAKQAIGLSERDLWPEEHRAEFDDLVSRVLRDGGAVSVDAVRRRGDGTRADLIYTLTPLIARDGNPAGFSVVAHDITSRKEMEDRLRLLVAEVDHRARNLLGTVQAIANLSAVNASNLTDFLAAFRKRIQALASTYSILSANDWGGVPMGDVISGAVAGFDGDGRIRYDGCNAVLKPKSAQDLALSLHELVVNAAKYGALSHSNGKVEIGWFRENRRLVLEWREIGGPPVSAPKRQGFGSRLIRHTGGSDTIVDHSFERTGVRCRFDLPGDCLAR